MRTTRRGFLSGVGASLTTLAASRGGFAGAPGTPIDLGEGVLDVRDLALPGERSLGRRMTLCVPRGLVAPDKRPLLVLLHGLGETGDERAGAYAWLERYGLATAYARLSHPPVARTSKRADFTDTHLASVNDELSRERFRGFVIACPYTPNINKAKNPKAALDGYAQWITEVVIPRARSEASVSEGASFVALDGCSLGGFVALEVFLRKPDAFGALGVVQAAIGAHRAPGYAERLAPHFSAAQRRGLHIETSTLDPFRKANESLSAELTRRGVTHESAVLPGPHDQPWLREVGTLEMLRFHDRRFRRLAPKVP